MLLELAIGLHQRGDYADAQTQCQRALALSAGLVIGLLLILLATPVVAEAPQWVLYTDPDKLMSVRFPGEPTVQDQDKRGARTRVQGRTAKFAEKNRDFTAAAVVLTVKAGARLDIESGLDAGRDQMMSQVQGKVTAEKSIKLDGVSGREFQFEAPGPLGKTHGIARLYMSVKPSVSYLAIARWRSEKPDPDASRFFASMRIGKKVDSKR